MSRIGTLHVVRAWEAGASGATDSAILACVERVLNSPGDRVLLIAGEDGEARAASLGLVTPLVICPRQRAGIVRGTASLLTTLGHVDRIHCWPGVDIKFMRKAAARAGQLATEIAAVGEDLAPPSRIPAGTRAEVRAALDVRDHECLVALAADPPDAWSAQDFIRACALAALVGRNVTALLPRSSPEMDRAKLTLRTTGVGVRMLTTRLPVWRLLPGCDAMVIDIREGTCPRSSPTFAQRWMAATGSLLRLPTVWSVAEGGRHHIRPYSDLPVHVARALNEHFITPELAGVRAS